MGRPGGEALWAGDPQGTYLFQPDIGGHDLFSLILGKERGYQFTRQEEPYMGCFVT